MRRGRRHCRPLDRLLWVAANPQAVNHRPTISNRVSYSRPPYTPSLVAQIVRGISVVDGKTSVVKYHLNVIACFEVIVSRYGNHVLVSACSVGLYRSWAIQCNVTIVL